MDLKNNDYFSLHQLIEAAQLDHLSSRFERLLREQSKAREGRTQLREACRFVNDSGNTFSRLLLSGPPSSPDVYRCQDALNRDCFRLTELANSVSNADANLGALETSFQESIGLLKPLILELANKAGVHITALLHERSSSAVQSSASDESIEDAELRDSPLRNYHDCLSKENALQEQIDGVLIQQRDIEGRRMFFVDQGRSFPESLQQTYTSLQKLELQLEHDYEQARINTKRARAHCKASGVTEARLETGGSITESAHLSRPKRVHEWLQHVNTQNVQVEAQNDGGETPFTLSSTRSIEDAQSVNMEDLSKTVAGNLDDILALHQGSDSVKDISNHCQALSMRDIALVEGGKNGEDIPSVHFDYDSSIGNHIEEALIQGTGHINSTEGGNRPTEKSRSFLERNQGDNPPNTAGDGLSVSSTGVLHRSIWAVATAANSNPLEPSSTLDLISEPVTVNRKDYRRRPRSFYVPGRAFKVLNGSIDSSSAPSGQESTVTFRTVGFDNSGEHVVQQILWFVVVKAEADFARCLRITTNEGKGVANLPQDQKKEHYSIVYTGDVVPGPTEGEEHQRHDTGGMRSPVRVIPHRKWEKLDEMHRLHWTNTYAVLYDVKVAKFGKVHAGSKMAFKFEFENLQQRRSGSKPNKRKTREARKHVAVEPVTDGPNLREPSSF